MPTTILSESFVFQFYICEHKNYNMHNYNFFLLFYVGLKVGCTLREACKLSILENRVLSKLFGTKTDGENCVNEELIYATCQVLL
jgi:hypothetical protein